MKKTLAIAAVVVIAAALLLTGCGRTTPPTPTVETPPPPTPHPPLLADTSTTEADTEALVTCDARTWALTYLAWQVRATPGVPEAHAIALVPASATPAFAEAADGHHRIGFVYFVQGTDGLIAAGTIVVEYRGNDPDRLAEADVVGCKCKAFLTPED